ncbi:MAG: chemotaxis protein CheR [Brevinematales bacterium]|nr:chemotaxis protein CheR [Brevinematales bacterium]
MMPGDFPLSLTKMTDEDSNRLRTYIQTNFGIRLKEEKRALLEGRLHKRLRVLGMRTFKEYCDFLFSDEGMKSEPETLMNLISTNKTDFFRENHHFEYLRDLILPELSASSLNIWSAACSTGEEPYSIAMTIENYLTVNDTGNLHYSILATDISTSALSAGFRAVYTEKVIEPVPPEFRLRFLMKNKDPDSDLYRVVPEMRAKVAFRYLNFMDHRYDIKEKMQVVFCRNALIYFDFDEKEKIVNKLCDHLIPGGYFFVGHSESLFNMKIPLRLIKPTIYVKDT